MKGEAGKRRMTTPSAVTEGKPIDLQRLASILAGIESVEFAEFYVRTCAEYEDLMAWRARQLAYRGYSCP